MQKPSTLARTHLSIKMPAAVLALGLSGVAYAQTAPDAGSLLKDIEQGLERSQQPTITPLFIPKASVQSSADGLKVPVNRIAFTGNSLIPEAELQAVVQSWVGQSLTSNELNRIAESVASTYQERGYLVRAYLPEQDLTDGTVTIAVIEGRVGAVRIDRAPDAKHLGNDKVSRFVLAQQELSAPVQPAKLHRAVTLLNELPGVAASFVLEPGAKEGESDVVVVLKDAPRTAGALVLDNTGSKSTGEHRLTATLNINSPLGMGDQIQIAANKSTGNQFARVGYSFPLGYSGLRLGLAASQLDYNYRQNDVDFEGVAKDSGLTLSYPLLRRKESNLDAVYGYNYKYFRNLVGKAEINNKAISANNLKLSGDVMDGILGGGIFQFSLGYAEGKLALDGNTADLTADQELDAPNRQGNYHKSNWSLARIQRLNASDSLLLSASGQFASRNLDAAEKFSGSGTYAVRAFDSTESSGDDGHLVSLEWRRQFSEQWQGSLFYDYSNVKRDHAVNKASLPPNALELAGVGGSINWGRPSDVQIKTIFAWQIANTANPTQTDPKVWINIFKAL
jgi:hemolysin activation/secretion protein